MCLSLYVIERECMDWGGKLYLHLLFMICRTRSEVLIQIVHRPKIICKQFAVNACSIIKIVDILCLIAIARS